MTERKRQIGVYSCHCRQEVISRVARSLSVDAYRQSGCGEELFNQMQSAEQLDMQKNVLLNGFDSSTENAAFFNAIFQKN
jgi:N-acetylglutamate synthase-like GNAT family acetyltransferase